MKNGNQRQSSTNEEGILMTGAELRRELDRAGISAYALAPRVAKHRNTVYRYLRGEVRITPTVAELIRRVLREEV